MSAAVKGAPTKMLQHYKQESGQPLASNSKLLGHRQAAQHGRRSASPADDFAGVHFGKVHVLKGMQSTLNKNQADA